MKNILIAIALVGSFLIFSQHTKAQCKDFAAEEGIKIMNPDEYIHDGRFNSIKLREGDDIRLFKSFYADEEYRVVVVGDENFEKLEFEILDFRGKDVIYSNKDDDAKSWDYTSSTSMRLIISVHVPLVNKNDPKKGCVAILFGLKKIEEEEEINE